jgi:DNA-binding IclR family transcriptional regulator
MQQNEEMPLLEVTVQSGAGPKSAIQSLDRGLVILEAVGRSRNPVSLSDLTELLGIDRSSAFRLAKTLKRRGFLTSPAGKTDYVLGPCFWRLARQYDWSNMLVRICHEHLRGLARQTGETAHLAVREGSHALFIDHVTANHPILVSGRTGELVPLHCTAHGKALLLDLDQSGIETVVGEGPLKSYTRRTIATVGELAEACAEMRAAGLATDDGEYTQGIRCVAAPVRDKDSAIIASIGISAPLMRFPPERHRAFAREVLKAAQEIRRVLDNQTEKEGV